MEYLRIQNLLEKNWCAPNRSQFLNIFVFLFGISFSNCISSGFVYQGNPLFGWLESGSEVRSIDPFPILSRYPDFVAKSFEFPVGGKFAEGYYVAQRFEAENGRFGGKKHLGEDWNTINGGDTDYAAPIYSMANGVVSEIADYGGGWGKVIRIVHEFPKTETRYYETVYAHLSTIDVVPGQIVRSSEWIGTIGDAGGVYTSHLHLELRTVIGGPLGGGYAEGTEGYLSATKFLMSYGPKEKFFNEDSFNFITEKPNP